MKTCPQCRKDYEDDNLNYCLDDGTVLAAKGSPDVAETIAMEAPRLTNQPEVAQAGGWNVPAANFASQPTKRSSKAIVWVLGILAGIVLLCGGGIGGLFYLGSRVQETKVAPERDKTPTEKTHPTENKPEEKWTTRRGEYELTMDKYRQLRDGMDRSEVESILGGKGTEISRSTGGGMRFSVNKWEGADYKSIILSFRNDKIMTKAQVGLDK